MNENVEIKGIFMSINVKKNTNNIMDVGIIILECWNSLNA